MRRRGTFLVVVALVLLAVFAGVDALRGLRGSASTRAGETRPTRGTTVAEQLERRGVSGVIYYSQPANGGGCSIFALELPEPGGRVRSG